MAINIFQGGSSSKNKGSKGSSSSRSVRAQQAQASLTTPSVTSDSGSTAVAKSGTLAKIGNVVGNIAGVASKFLPGIGGTIAKGLANVFNDPEWWRSVPGDAVTLNAPLRPINVQHTGSTVYKLRTTFAEAVSTVASDVNHPYVIEPSVYDVTQYLMPEIRRVVNAVPLQAAADYATVLSCNATLYALWQNLKRYDYMLKHGQTYLANMDDPSFPILQVTNAAYLQSTIGRLEEYLRANVRLPHTLCEYLAWRFGRVYKTNNSAKAGLILYNVVDINSSITDIDTKISSLMATPSGTVALQQANADLYNTYFDHDFMVEIRDDTQFSYDAKEFCLRTNMDVRGTWPGSDAEYPDCVYIDSALDNPTTYMASTVSTVGTQDGATSWLFPVRKLYVWMPFATHDFPLNGFLNLCDNRTPIQSSQLFTQQVSGSPWMRGTLAPNAVQTQCPTGSDFAHAVALLVLSKAADLYNKDVYLFLSDMSDGSRGFTFDLTALDLDMGLVQSTTLGNEHVYAFANLVAVGRKHSMSYKEAETLVARDTANLVEKLDIGQSR